MYPMTINATKTTATAEDFARWAATAAGMSSAELAFAISDCDAAARAVDGHDAIKAGRYRDELHAYCAERATRRAA